MSFNKSSFSAPRGRGNRRGGSSYRGAWVKALPKVPSGPYGPKIDSIDIKGLLIDEASPEITNVAYVASYNWLDGTKPIILVPGSPPAWAPPTEDSQLEQDKGDFFRDINAAHYPKFPMEPALRSIFTLHPSFELPTIDIAGCGSTIGNLLRFAGSLPKPFRFDVDVIGETVFFLQRGNSPTELIEDVRGYGHTFPESYTTWDSDVRSSVSHQRIISYDFGELRMLVRTETDAYVKRQTSSLIGSLASQNSLGGSGSSMSTTKELLASQYNLADDMESTSVSNSSPSRSQKLEVKTQGREISQEQIFDIKTRAKANIFDMDEILPRLWLNQTPKFLLAYHEYGIFNRPEVKDIRKQIETWQNNNSSLLGRFHAVLRRIVDVARDSDKQQLEVSWDGNGPLLITEQVGAGRRALPLDLRELCGDASSLEV